MRIHMNDRHLMNNPSSSCSCGRSKCIRCIDPIRGSNDPKCTSGVDPLSRRALWRTLTSVRHDRTIVFTTHVSFLHAPPTVSALNLRSSSTKPIYWPIKSLFLRLLVDCLQKDHLWLSSRLSGRATQSM